MHNSGNSFWSGLILLAAGGLLMARQLGADIPDWMFSWHYAFNCNWFNDKF